MKIKFRKDRRTWFLNLSLSIISVIVFLLITEIVLRILGFPSKIMEWEIDKNSGYSFMAPNQDYIEKWYDNLVPFRVRINSLGLRDNEIKYKDGFKIFAIGDSFTFGTGVKGEDTFVELLEGQLRSSFPDLDTEVINGGHGGATINFEYELLRQKGLALKPDIVLIAFYRNDVEDYFSDSQHRKIYTSVAIPFKKYLRKTATYNILMKMNLYVLAKRIGRNIKNAQSISDSKEDFYNPSLIGQYQEMWQQYLRKLKDTIELCKENNIEPTLLIIPDEFQVKNAYLASTPQTILKEFALQNNIIVIDPLEILRKRSILGIKDYIPIDSHLNTEGHKIISELIYDVLIDNKLLVRK